MKHGMGHNMGRHVRVLDTTPSALPSRDGVELRTATPNFFAITQYNRSYFYAASVADLAQALDKP
jgi:membrane-bound lytic murein transglycosylase B